jgi:hypothetical protein
MEADAERVHDCVKLRSLELEANVFAETRSNQKHLVAMAEKIPTVATNGYFRSKA